MAFGTGHHETTGMMLQHILENNMAVEQVLDMGCGTGILGILASMRGAKRVLGIDIDKWCTDNTEENCHLNNINNMTVQLGGAELLPGTEVFDAVLANINRNILLADMSAYVMFKARWIIVLKRFLCQRFGCYQCMHRTKRINVYFAQRAKPMGGGCVYKRRIVK
jgi:ribosomal protein L11 methyltransferase